MKKVSLIILLYFSIWNFGCASIATKGNLPELKLPVMENKKSLTYRFYRRTPSRGKDGVRLDTHKNEEQQLKDFLKQSEQFGEVKEYPQKLELISFSGENTSAEEKMALRINFPVDTDLFLDIESEDKDYGPHGGGYIHWGLIHILSLGIIPIAINNNIKLTAILYDRNGIELSRSSAFDESTIWGWTPLFFFNGFKMIRQFDDVSQPIRKNAIMHLLYKLPLHSELK